PEHEPPLSVEYRRAARLCEHDASILVTILVDEAEKRPGILSDRSVLTLAFNMQLVIVFANDLLWSISQDDLYPRIAVGVAPAGVLLPKPLARHFRDVTEPRLAFNQRLPIAFSPGDVFLYREVMRDFAARVAQGFDCLQRPVEAAVLTTIFHFT